MTGIYKITNLINGKFYIGLSCNIRRRFWEHTSKANKRCGACPILARAMRKYGSKNFIVEVLEECQEHELSAREVFWIMKLRPQYNRSQGGLGIRGVRHTDKTKRILSLRGKAQWALKTELERAEFVKNNLKGPRVGHIVSEATREKLRLKLSGRSLSESHKRNIGISNRVSMIGNTNGKYNRKHEHTSVGKTH